MNFRSVSKQSSHRIGWLFCALTAPCQPASCGQEANLILPPVPEMSLRDIHLSEIPLLAPSPVAAAPIPAPAQEMGRRRFSFDRTAISMGLIQAASELYDGVTTRYFLRRCSDCIEGDPLSHFLLGSRPTWARMITVGSIEGFATTYLHQYMRRSSHKLVRRCAPFAPLVVSGIHLVEGSRNLSLKNNTPAQR
jgi:hypothetical protein